MKYIVLPAEILAEVTQETLDYFHLSPRYSIDGSEVLMKVDNYEKLFPCPTTLELDSEEAEDIIYPFPTYDSPSEEFEGLLSSTGWAGEEKPT